MSSPAVSSFRAHEAQRLVDMVRLSRVTLLVAEPGSDKSALLRSIVMPLLERDAVGAKAEIAILFDAWDEAPLSALQARIEQVAAAALPAVPIADRSALPENLRALQEALGVTFLVIFDRFEEYLRKPQDRTGVAEFDASLVEIVNDRSLQVNFLLAFEADAEPLLVRLRTRIPHLGDARVRLPGTTQAPAESGERTVVKSHASPTLPARVEPAAPIREGTAANHPKPGRKTESSIFAAWEAVHSRTARTASAGQQHAGPVTEVDVRALKEGASQPSAQPNVVEPPQPEPVPATTTPSEVVEAMPPLVAETAPPPIEETAPPLVAETAPPPIAETAPPPIAESAPPPIAEPAPPIAESAPPPIAEPAPPPIAETAPPPIDVATSSLARRAHASAAREKPVPQAPRLPERVAPKRRLVPVAWAAVMLIAGALIVLWERGSGERAAIPTSPPAKETLTAAPRDEAPSKPSENVAATSTPPVVETPAANPSEAKLSPPVVEAPAANPSEAKLSPPVVEAPTPSAPAAKLSSSPPPPAGAVSAPSAVQPQTASPKAAPPIPPPAPVEAVRPTQPARRSELFAGRPGVPPPAVRSAGRNAVQGAVPPQVAAKPPLAAAAPPAPAVEVPAVPALYINVTSEAQRARAEQLVKPLNERGIRVAGIRVVPPNPDGTHIRYNHDAERNEAMKLSITLRDFGLGTQHLRQAEESASPVPARQYELWLPATGESAR